MSNNPAIPGKFHITTFGCQMNFHDSERLAGAFNAAGWEEVEAPGDADAVIIITCCVRQSAEDRFWGFLSSLKPLKREKGTLFAVGGCVAQNEGEAVFKRAPHVDLVFGTHQYPHIAELLDAAAGQAVCVLDMPGLELDGLPLSRHEKFRAWVPIIYGCDNYCTYCVVPYTRGRETSRPREELIREIGTLVDEGALEVVLLGQNVNSYDRDGEGFSPLLSAVASHWPDIRIRFLTSHPRDFTPDIIKVMSDHPNVCRYVHLPLQAGSDSILKAMGRGYDRAAYLEKIDAIREGLPGVAVSSDLMVGFPGERRGGFSRNSGSGQVLPLRPGLHLLLQSPSRNGGGGRPLARSPSRYNHGKVRIDLPPWSKSWPTQAMTQTSGSPWKYWSKARAGSLRAPG